MDNQQAGQRFGGSSSLNKVMIIGNLGKEPEMRFTPGGVPVASFSVATNRVYKTPDGERKEETEWFSIVAWNRLAETCNQFLTKGQKVYVEGRMRTRTWDGQDGQKHYKTELIANQVIFLDKKASGPVTENSSEEQQVGEAGDIEPQDIPF
jgi:single-strand DNA-binding protein